MPSLPRPRLSANFAITWDGRISTRRRTPSDFSSPVDKTRFLELRSRADAVLVSARTAAADHMTIGLPEALRAERVARGQSAYPLRILLSNTGRIDPALRVFTETFSPIVIFSTTRMPRRVREQLAPLAELHLYEGAQVNLAHMLATLRREYRVRRAHCEGGGRLFRGFLAESLVDDLHLTLCPRIFGSPAAPTLTGPPGEFLPKSGMWKLMKMETIGDECFLRYRAQR
ncbi:MAG TPA: RibD family protein [Chthoniobacteraceae bacterium]|jgi:riboflavin-specific deaminase-like protein|nr:RibD family protein [Chthoniobacteraceae bacterium]